MLEGQGKLEFHFVVVYCSAQALSWKILKIICWIFNKIYARTLFDAWTWNCVKSGIFVELDNTKQVQTIQNQNEINMKRFWFTKNIQNTYKKLRNTERFKAVCFIGIYPLFSKGLPFFFEERPFFSGQPEMLNILQQISFPSAQRRRFNFVPQLSERGHMTGLIQVKKQFRSVHEVFTLYVLRGF